MAKIGIFYGSSTGNTEFAAHKIQLELGVENADLIDVSGAVSAQLDRYDFLIFGTSTWGLGEPQDDFDEFLPEIEKADLNGKTVALFGLGDQIVYEYSFLNALGILYQKLKTKGCKITGQWPVDGYTFKKSGAVINNRFIGLAIDEENQSELTDERVKKWVRNIKKEIPGN